MVSFAQSILGYQTVLRDNNGTCDRRLSVSVERTLVLVKPNGFKLGLVGEIISRFEQRGLTLPGCRLLGVSRDLAERHYKEHEDKPFFSDLVNLSLIHISEPTRLRRISY